MSSVRNSTNLTRADSADESVIIDIETDTDMGSETCTHPSDNIVETASGEVVDEDQEKNEDEPKEEVGNQCLSGSLDAHSDTGETLVSASTDSLTLPEDEPSEETPDGVVEPDTTSEPPMPSPKECFEKHIGNNLIAKLNTRTFDEVQQLMSVHSPYDVATEVEKRQRAMKPHAQHLHIMQNMDKTQVGQSHTMRTNWEKTYGRFVDKYKEADASFMEQKEALQTIVKEYVNTLIDNEQQLTRDEYNACKQLSKGRRKHLWEALQNDDAPKLLRTLETPDEVKRAAYHCTRPTHENEDSVLVLTVDDAYRLPANGASKCLSALFERHATLFATENIQAAIQRIVDKNLQDSRKECLDILHSQLPLRQTI